MPSHKRKAHPRTNKNQTVSHVKKTVVQTKGPQKKTPTKTKPQTPLQSIIQQDTPNNNPPFQSIEELRSSLLFFLANAQESLEGNHFEGNNNLSERETATLLTLKKALQKIDFGIEQDPETDDVLFAFEHPEWTTRGFNRQESMEWTALEIEPNEAAEWKTNGFTPFDATPWVIAAGYRNRVKPSDAALYRDAGITAEEGSEWTLYEEIEAASAIGWIHDGIPRKEAALWESFDADNNTYRQWRALGVTSYDDAWTLNNLGHERIQAWTEAGAKLADIPYLRLFEPFKKYGYTEKDFVTIHNTQLVYEAVVDWLIEKIPANQIRTFLLKGYTPKRAAQKLAKNIDATQAPDRRNGEPVPGKAWLEHKQTIQQKTTTLNAGVNTKTKLHPTGEIEVICSLYDNNDPQKILEEHHYLYTNTGRFIKTLH